MGQRYPVPPPAGSYIPAYVPVISYFGGAVGDDVAVSSANATTDFSPKTQVQKAALTGNTMVTDVGRARGVLEPDDPYPKASDTPPAAPTITGLAPNTAVAGSVAPVAVTITGTGFTAWSSVKTGNYPTDYVRYISPTQLLVGMIPSRSVAGVVQVVVSDHGVDSAPSNFTFT
jgi:hypothetical protein